MRGGIATVVADVTPEIINAQDQIYLYRLNDGADIYIVSNNTMYANEDCSYAFYALRGLCEIHFNNFIVDTRVTNMNCMFSSCSWLDTFYGMEEWDTSGVTEMMSMFSGCEDIMSLEKIGLLNTCSVENMSGMFSDCVSLTSLDGLEEFDTSLVGEMGGIFSGCENLLSVDAIYGWNTSNLTGLREAFSGCTNLNSIDLSSWDLSMLYDLDHLFADCQNLTLVEGLHGIGASYDHFVILTSYMFCNCSSLTSLDLSGFTDQTLQGVDYMFCGCTALESLQGINNWVCNWNAECMFYGCSSLTELDLSDWSIGGVDHMDYMFAYCTSLEYVNVTGWKIANEWMKGVFRYCSALTTIEGIDNWDTSRMRYSNFMFQGCTSLESLDLSKWKIRYDCVMTYMFDGCTSLISVGNLSGWGIQLNNVIDGMFYNCSALVELDLSGWQGSEDMNALFYGCTNLTTIYQTNDFYLNVFTDSKSMFYGCISLVGGNGTTYDPNNVDGTYARLDGGPNSSTPGYFTAK